MLEKMGIGTKKGMMPATTAGYNRLRMRRDAENPEPAQHVPTHLPIPEMLPRNVTLDIKPLTGRRLHGTCSWKELQTDAHSMTATKGRDRAACSGMSRHCIYKRRFLRISHHPRPNLAGRSEACSGANLDESKRPTRMATRQ